MRIFLLTCLILLTGCKDTIDRVVALGGDSIMAGSIQAIAFDLNTDQNRGYLVVPMAVPGSAFAHTEGFSDHWIPRINAVRSRINIDIAVIQAGVNDSTGTIYTSSQYDAALDQIMGSLDGVQVIWVLPWGKQGVYTPEIIKIIDCLSAASARWSNLHLLSFQYIVALDGHDINEYLNSYPDNLHLNAAGQIVYAQLIQSVLLDY